jgi:hypothetical protein
MATETLVSPLESTLTLHPPRQAVEVIPPGKPPTRSYASRAEKLAQLRRGQSALPAISTIRPPQSNGQRHFKGAIWDNEQRCWTPGPNSDPCRWNNTLQCYEPIVDVPLPTSWPTTTPKPTPNFHERKTGAGYDYLVVCRKPDRCVDCDEEPPTRQVTVVPAKTYCDAQVSAERGYRCDRRLGHAGSCLSLPGRRGVDFTILDAEIEGFMMEAAEDNTARFIGAPDGTIEDANTDIVADIDRVIAAHNDRVMAGQGAVV